MATAQKHTPFRPIHPGEVVKDEIESRGISQKKFAAQLGMSYTMLNEILNGKRPVTATFALLFEAALGIEAETFLSMQSRYNLQTERQDKVIMERFKAVRNLCASVL